MENRIVGDKLEYLAGEIFKQSVEGMTFRLLIVKCERKEINRENYEAKKEPGHDDLGNSQSIQNTKVSESRKSHCQESRI